MNYLVWWFLQPGHLILFACTAGVVLWLLGRRRIAEVLLLAGAGGLALAGLTPLATWLIAPLEDRFPAVPPQALHPDVIVVLSGAERVALSGWRAQPHVNDLASRLMAFLNLARHHPGATIVFTGGGRIQQIEGRAVSQATIARRFFADAGLDAGRLLFENQSTSTCSSADHVATLLGPEARREVVLVTSAFHMPRAVACFRARQVRVTPYPTDYRRISGGIAFDPWTRSLAENLRVLELAAHEWLGLLYYRMLGRTDELFPAPLKEAVDGFDSSGSSQGESVEKAYTEPQTAP